MRICVSCKTRYQKNSGVTFHKFPTDSTLKVWLKNMNIKNWTPKRSDHLCSKHFSKDCLRKHFSRTALKKGSMPTIFFDESTLPEEMKDREAEINNEYQEVIDEKFVEVVLSDTNSNHGNGTTIKSANLTNICDQIKHDHHYEISPRLYRRALQRVRKALRISQARVQILTRHVKRLKTRVFFLKKVIKQTKNGHQTQCSK